MPRVYASWSIRTAGGRCRPDPSAAPGAADRPATVEVLVRARDLPGPQELPERARRASRRLPEQAPDGALGVRLRRGDLQAGLAAGQVLEQLVDARKILVRDRGWASPDGALPPRPRPLPRPPRLPPGPPS